MFEIYWAQKNSWKREKKYTQEYTQVCKDRLDRDVVEKTLLFHWEEHCVECAIPTCYKSCLLYTPRPDRKCSRFVYGIYPNPNFAGILDFGADIRFKRWGRLQTNIYGHSITIAQERAFQRINYVITSIVNPLSFILRPISPRHILNRALSFFRHKLFYAMGRAFSDKRDLPDEFILEVFLVEDTPHKLILEYTDRLLKFRQRFDILPGPNLYKIPVADFNFSSCPPQGIISIFPENNSEPRLIFTWLNFVKYKPSYKKDTLQKNISSIKPATKVKCVAWDLDNTLWEGILVEDGAHNLRPDNRAIELIKKLDERGVIQTIVSKNNYDDAWTVIKKLKLQDYFIYPAILWGPKSESLLKIANRLNINIDTFAIIDDSPFEREEVISRLPQVRAYSPEQIPELLSYEEFDLLVTEESKARRSLYFSETKRQRVQESFSGSYEDFLRSCQMELKIFVPKEEKHIQRCLELIQRTNQLNLSARRYTIDEIYKLLSSKNKLCVALSCRDRFGDYGIVGYVCIDERKESPIIMDFVLSCRVAQKKIEYTFLQWLSDRERKLKKNILLAELIQTKRNKPLLQVFEDMPFELIEKRGNSILMGLQLDKPIKNANIIKTEANVPS